MAIEISAQDVAEIEQFLETLLTDEVPEGRFTKGTALRDLTIKALAFVVAQQRKENQEVRSLQSLLTVREIATGVDPDRDRAVSDAVAAILSNWFVNVKNGGFARGVLNIFFSRKQDYLLPGNNRFLYDRARAFFPDVTDPTQTIVIPASSLTPVLAASGVVTGYVYRQRVVAAKTGTTYNVAPATWQGGRQFSQYVTNISSQIEFTGGRDRETSEEAIDRAGTAIAVRNLINSRSVDATLRDRFSELVRLTVIGMGDPEMQRDRKVEIASGIDLHVGGHFDVYLELPRTTVTFEGLLGGRFLRPDNVINVFRDSTITDWTAEAIAEGDVIRVSAGLPDVPRDFIIREILPTELRVSTIMPFSAATDEDATFVDYFIYRPVFGPDVQLLPAVGVLATGQTSRQMETEGRLTLPGGAHYEITEVTVIDPDVGDPNINATDGYVHFPVRTNDTPGTGLATDLLEYQVINNDPASAQSQLQFEELLLDPAYNGKTVRVVYETLAGLSTIHDFTRDRFERIAAANILARGYNPVYLSALIPYKLKATATGTPDEEALKTAVVDLINNFDPNDVIDVSDIIECVRQADANIGTVFPFDIEYDFIVPDGRVLHYRTSDEVTLDPAKLEIDLTSVDNRLDNPLGLGVSDRTVRYMTRLARISFELR
jgi:hypothetical protein